MTITKEELTKLVKMAWEVAQDADMESGMVNGQPVHLPKAIVLGTDALGRMCMNEPRWQLFQMLINNMVPKYTINENTGTFEHKPAAEEF